MTKESANYYEICLADDLLAFELYACGRQTGRRDLELRIPFERFHSGSSDENMRQFLRQIAEALTHLCAAPRDVDLQEYNERYLEESAHRLWFARASLGHPESCFLVHGLILDKALGSSDTDLLDEAECWLRTAADGGHLLATDFMKDWPKTKALYRRRIDQTKK